MNTYQLEQILSADPYVQSYGYLGVYPIDQARKLPKIYPSCFIINTDPSTKPGKHWIGIIRFNKTTGYYFDSAGLSPETRSGMLPILRTCSAWIFNRKTLQSLFTTTCGQYCCFFLLHAARGYTMDAITYLLDGRSPSENDIFIFTYIQQRYPHIANSNSLSPVVE
jgi:hypothetical protein